MARKAYVLLRLSKTISLKKPASFLIFLVFLTGATVPAVANDISLSDVLFIQKFFSGEIQTRPRGRLATTVEITMSEGDSGKYDISYPELGCHGILLRSKIHRHHFHEKITSQNQNCWETGFVILAKSSTGPNDVFFSWSDEEYGRIRMEAFLTGSLKGVPSRNDLTGAMNLYMSVGPSAFDSILKATHGVPRGSISQCSRDGCKIGGYIDTWIYIDDLSCSATGENLASCNFVFRQAMRMDTSITGPLGNVISNLANSSQQFFKASAKLEYAQDEWFLSKGTLSVSQ